MTDDVDIPETSESEPQGPRGGERLAEARRERQITVLEIAKELHLDESKVRSLESNEFEALGAPVFAKGHLKTYAQLVGLDVNDILTDYYKMTRQDNLPPVVVARRRMHKEVAPGPWIAVIVVIIVAAAAYWWFAVYSLQQQAPVQTPASVPAGQADTVPADADRTPIEPVEVEPEPEAVVAEPETDEPAPAASEQAPVASEPPADDEVRLSLSFSGDCWTEVSDATGRRLFFRMGRPGEIVELTGTAPFAVLFGDVDNVAVRVNGNDYPISTNSPGSRTARLTINQP